MAFVEILIVMFASEPTRRSPWWGITAVAFVATLLFLVYLIVARPFQSKPSHPVTMGPTASESAYNFGLDEPSESPSSSEPVTSPSSPTPPPGTGIPSSASIPAGFGSATTPAKQPRPGVSEASRNHLDEAAQNPYTHNEKKRPDTNRTAKSRTVNVSGIARANQLVTGPDDNFLRGFVPVNCQETSPQGNKNGQIPTSDLCKVPFNGSHYLRADAASYLEDLNTSYRKKFGTNMCLSASYRSLQQQQADVRANPKTAWPAGTSNHGWGLAVDLCGGVEKFGSVQHSWMKTNAPSSSWKQPAWAQQGGALPQAAHWEFFPPGVVGGAA